MAEVYRELARLGFKRGISSPCIFWHVEKRIRLVVHGDDFTVLGHTGALDWFKSELGKLYVLKHRGRIGPARQDTKSMSILNRVVEWTDEGIWYEPDQRHVELILKDLGC